MATACIPQATFGFEPKEKPVVAALRRDVALEPVAGAERRLALGRRAVAAARHQEVDQVAGCLEGRIGEGARGWSGGAGVTSTSPSARGDLLVDSATMTHREDPDDACGPIDRVHYPVSPHAELPEPIQISP